MAKRSWKKVKTHDRRGAFKALCAAGTLAHNRAFTERDMGEYAGFAARDAIPALTSAGLLEKVGKGEFYPTKPGWRAVEIACGIKGRSRK